MGARPRWFLLSLFLPRDLTAITCGGSWWGWRGRRGATGPPGGRQPHVGPGAGPGHLSRGEPAERGPSDAPRRRPRGGYPLRDRHAGRVGPRTGAAEGPAGGGRGPREARGASERGGLHTGPPPPPGSGPRLPLASRLPADGRLRRRRHQRTGSPSISSASASPAASGPGSRRRCFPEAGRRRGFAAGRRPWRSRCTAARIPSFSSVFPPGGLPRSGRTVRASRITRSRSLSRGKATASWRAGRGSRPPSSPGGYDRVRPSSRRRIAPQSRIPTRGR